MRRRVDFEEHRSGGGEFLAFIVVVALSASAFMVVGSERPPSTARVVSMQDTLLDRTVTVSSVATDEIRPVVPVPTPRPQLPLHATSRP